MGAFHRRVHAGFGSNGTRHPYATIELGDTPPWGLSSVGEHLLCKQGVRGSNPLASTKPQYPGHSTCETNMTQQHYEYDVGLSFAGEQREYVEQVADDLNSRGIRVFYDDYEKSTLWGKDLYAHLTEVYQHRCEFCVIFVSEAYADKVWTNLERKSAQARAMEENKEYILPARFDDTPIPGLLRTVGYVDLNQTSPEQLCDLISGKLGQPERREYLPPIPDRLFDRLGIEDDLAARKEASSHALSLLHALRRMTPDERDAVASLMRYGCHGELPENLHIHVDLLRRHTGKPVAQLQRLLGDVRSLGFNCSLAENREHAANLPGAPLGDYDFFYLYWFDLINNEDRVPALLVASEMISVGTEGYCEECGDSFLERLDFSQLASVTTTEESHSFGDGHEICSQG